MNTNDDPPSPIEAFLFSSNVKIENGNQVLYYYGRAKKQENTNSLPIEIQITNNKPVFFVPQNTNTRGLPIYSEKNVSLQSENFIPLKALYFKNKIILFQTAKLLKSRGILVFESDVQPEARYLMERFIYGGVQLSGSYSQKSNRLVFINPQLKPIKCKIELSIVSLDIETGIRDGLLYSVGLHFTHGSYEKKIVIVNGTVSELDKSKNKEIKILECETESIMIKKLNQFFLDYDPDIIIGWNVIGFDFNFLMNKSKELKEPLTIARNGSSPDLVILKNKNQILNINGRVVLDGPTVLRSAFYNFSDFKLETVSQELLGIGKKIKKTKDPALEIERMFFSDRANFIHYNIVDCILVANIFKKTGMIELQKKRTEISGMFLDQTGRSVAAFDYSFLPGFHRKNFAAKNIADIHYDKPATGGFVMEPEVGLHQHVLVLDFKSLYPSIIQTFKIDPLSRIQNKIEPVMTPTGHTFSKSQNILPDFISQLLEERQSAKKSNDSHLSMAVKILMNSFYGVMGSAGCRFYHPDLPAAITGTGQWLLKKSRVWLEEQGYKVLYGDTDSLFVTKDEITNDTAHTTGGKIARELTSYWGSRIQHDFNTKSYLEMEYEKHFTKFFLPPARTGGGAKKRYTGLWNKEGKEVLHFVGMESVRTDWSILAREFQIELYDRFFHEQEIELWIIQLVKKLKRGELDEKLTITKRLRKPIDEYVNNVPQHVKAARLLNKPVRRISYKMTLDGPMPIELMPQNIDYKYYLEHQLQPIADTLLWLLGIEFTDLSGPKQLNLFC